MRALPHLPLDVQTLFEQALKPHHEVCEHVPGVVNALVDQLHQAVPANVLRGQWFSSQWVRVPSRHKNKSMVSRTASAGPGDAAKRPCSCLQPRD